MYFILRWNNSFSWWQLLFKRLWFFIIEIQSIMHFTEIPTKKYYTTKLLSDQNTQLKVSEENIKLSESSMQHSIILLLVDLLYTVLCNPFFFFPWLKTFSFSFFLKKSSLLMLFNWFKEIKSYLPSECLSDLKKKNIKRNLTKEL